MLDLDLVFNDDRPVGVAELPGSAGDKWARRAAALLARVADDGRRADWRERFEHRAGVCEYCGELGRTEAERLAFGELEAAMRAAGELERTRR